MRSAIIFTIAALLGQTLAQEGMCSAVTNTCFINGNAFECTHGTCSEEGSCHRETPVGLFPPVTNTLCS